jgi:hypothetical protein
VLRSKTSTTLRLELAVQLTKLHLSALLLQLLQLLQLKLQRELLLVILSARLLRAAHRPNARSSALLTIALSVER